MRFHPALIITMLMMLSSPGWAQESPSSTTVHVETSPAQTETTAPQEGATGDDQIHTRGLEVFGCPLSLDAGAMTRCFQRVLDREGDRIRDQMQREFDHNPYLAKLDHERKILQAAAQLPLQPLMNCLKNVPNQPQADLGAQVQRWLANPGIYSKDAVEQVLAQTRSDLSAIFREEVQARQMSRAPLSPAQSWDRSVGDTRSVEPTQSCRSVSDAAPVASSLSNETGHGAKSVGIGITISSDIRSLNGGVAHQMQAQSVGRVLLTVAGGQPRPQAPAGSTGTAGPSFRPIAPSIAQVQPGLITPRGITENMEADTPVRQTKSPLAERSHWVEDTKWSLLNRPRPRRCQTLSLTRERWLKW